MRSFWYENLLNFVWHSMKFHICPHASVQRLGSLISKGQVLTKEIMIWCNNLYTLCFMASATPVVQTISLICDPFSTGKGMCIPSQSRINAWINWKLYPSHCTYLYWQVQPKPLKKCFIQCFMKLLFSGKRTVLII